MNIYESEYVLFLGPRISKSKFSNVEIQTIWLKIPDSWFIVDMMVVNWISMIATIRGLICDLW